MHHLSLSILLILAVTGARAASTQTTLSNIHPIYASAYPGEQLRVTSAFGCGFWNASSTKCTLEWTLEYVSIDPPPDLASFTATLDPSGINLKADLGYDVAYSRTFVAEVPNVVSGQPIAADPLTRMDRPVSYSGIGGLPNTEGYDYYEHAKQTTPAVPPGFFDPIKDALDGVGESIGLTNSIVENPLLASLHSEVKWLGGESWEYTYIVTNETDEMMMFDWVDAGRSDTVDANGTLMWSMLADSEPVAVYGTLDATVLGGFYSGPSTTILPLAAVVPLPAPLVLLGTGMLALGVRQRRPANPRPSGSA